MRDYHNHDKENQIDQHWQQACKLRIGQVQCFNGVAGPVSSHSPSRAFKPKAAMRRQGSRRLRRFRTIQVCPKDLAAPLRQVEHAVD
jgi:hypothetical protein